MGVVVRTAVDWAKANINVGEIEKRISRMAKKNRTYFLVDTLVYLQKGGQVGAASALLGSLLQMKPILAFSDSQVEVLEKQRIKAKAVGRFIELVLAECQHSEDAYLHVQNGGVIDEDQDLAQDLSKLTGIKNIPITFLPPAILVHGDLGVLGVSFFVK